MTHLLNHTRPRVEVITPQRATQILMTHQAAATEATINRPLNEINLQKLTQDMRDGTYAKTYMPIVIGHKGILVNGQHRLNAIVRSGLAFEQIVVRDNSLLAPREYAGDSGKPRDYGYITGLGGRNVSLAKAALRLGLSENNPTTHRVEEIWAKLSPEYDLSIGPIRNRLGITKAPVLLAAMAAGRVTGQHAYIREQLNHMANDNVQALSKQCCSLWASLIEDYTKSVDKEEIAALAFGAFMPNRMKQKRLPDAELRAEYLEAFKVAVREILA